MRGLARPPTPTIPLRRLGGLRFWERAVEIEREPSPRERSETLSPYTRVGILTLIASPLGLTGIERAGTLTP
jgi:hypothetical protein